MKNNKVLSIAVAAITLLSIAAAGTYAWFVITHDSQKLNVSTGFIDACVSAFSRPANNLLPGEVHVLDLHPTSILNSGSRDMVCEFTIGEASKAALAYGKVPSDLFPNDYKLEGGIWNLTMDRLMKVAKFDMIDMIPEFPWLVIDGKYYAFIEAGQVHYVGRGQITMLPELGGNVKLSNGTYTDDRSFEHGMNLSVANRIVGVQNTKEACIDIFGADVANQFPYEWFE